MLIRFSKNYLLLYNLILYLYLKKFIALKSEIRKASIVYNTDTLVETNIVGRVRVNVVDARLITGSIIT